jgi:hypothetical protein
VLRALKEYQPFAFVGILFIIIFHLPGGLLDLPEGDMPEEIVNEVKEESSKGINVSKQKY